MCAAFVCAAFEHHLGGAVLLYELKKYLPDYGLDEIPSLLRVELI